MNRQPEPILAPQEDISETVNRSYSGGRASSADRERRGADMSQSSALIVNADDWGRDHETTERIFECIRRGTVSSVSAMVFMEDSERAAAVARESGVDAGLHLNFTTPFSSPCCSSQLMERQRKVASHLRRCALSKVVFHPGLVRSFEYVIAAQMDEFRRLYGSSSDRIDGHHHMHLCANVLLGRLLPAGTITRRNFSFQPGQKSFANRFYRSVVDRMLAGRHRLTDFFFSLPPLEPAGRLQGIFALARQHVVEVETHPVNPEEYRFLMGDEIFRRLADLTIASSFRFAPTRGGRTAQ